MKRLSLYLFLIFFTLQVSSWADDIRDFEIEGISLGDSALNFFGEEEIKNGTGPYYPKNKKLIMVATQKLSEDYDMIQFHTKDRDKKYIIESIEGVIWYESNIKDCYKKMDEVVNDLTKIFDDVKPSKKRRLENTYGKGTDISLKFKSGDVINVACNDYKKKYEDFTDGLKIAILSKEFKNWIEREAF